MRNVSSGLVFTFILLVSTPMSVSEATGAQTSGADSLPEVSRAEYSKIVVRESMPALVKRDKYGYPKAVPDKYAIVETFKQRKFQRLNTLLEGYQELFEQDFHNEYLTINCYTPFFNTERSYLGILNDWVKATPSSYAPWTARSSYYYSLASEVRGTRLARDTSAEQFQQMREYAQLARQDLKKALQINQRVLQAHRIAVHVEQISGGLSGAAAAMEGALAACPECFVLPMVFMDNLTPRWGGSYELMDGLAQKAQKHTDKNPKLRLLLGASDADRADMSERNGLVDQGLVQINKALSYGDYSDWLRQRARLYWVKKLYHEALDDFDRTIELSPDDIKARAMRAVLLKRFKREEEAVRDVVHAYNLKKNDDYLNQQREWAIGWIVSKARELLISDPTSALESLELAEKLNAPDIKIVPVKSAALWEAGDKKVSIEVFYQVGPGDKNFLAHGSLDRTLSSLDPGKAVAFWQEYSTLRSDDPGGFLYMGREAVRKDMPSAIKYLLRAMVIRPSDRNLGYHIYMAVNSVGNREKETRFWEVMTEKLPAEPVGFYYRGHYRNEAGLSQQAVADFGKACSLGYDAGCSRREKILTVEDKKTAGRPAPGPDPAALFRPPGPLKPFKEYDIVRKMIAGGNHKGAESILYKVPVEKQGPFYYSMLWQADYVNPLTRERTRRDLERGMKKFPDSLILKADHADFIYRTGDIRGALNETRQLFVVHGQKLDREGEERVLGVQLKCYRSLGNFTAMSGLCDYLIGKYPDREEYLIWGMEVNGLLGQYDKAAMKFKSCLSNNFLGEHLAGALSMMALAAYYNNDLDGSRKFQEKLLEINTLGRYALTAGLASLLTGFKTAEVSQRIQRSQSAWADPRKDILYSALLAMDSKILSQFNEHNITRRAKMSLDERTILTTALVHLEHPMAVTVAKELAGIEEGNPYFRYLLGLAMDKTGDSETALHLTYAAGRLPNPLFKALAGM